MDKANVLSNMKTYEQYYDEQHMNNVSLFFLE